MMKAESTLSKILMHLLTTAKVIVQNSPGT